MALKTLELRARRDAFVVFFLGFFLVLTHFLYSQSLPVAVGDAGLGVGPADRAGAGPHAGRPAEPARRPAALAARTALLGAPVMALLFVLFPRIGPLWGVPQDGIATTGLSNTMQHGLGAEVALDDSDRDAGALRRHAAAARADVLPRPGADALRRHRVAPLGLPFAPPQPAGAAADAADERHAGRATR